MHKNVLLLASIFFLFGCSQKQAECKNQKKSDFVQLFNKDEVYHSGLVNTQKAQLVASFETKALLTATYLNPVFEKRACKKRFKNKMIDGEYFFVGVFIADGEKHEFNTNGYSLTLDEENPIEFTLVDKNDSLLYEMPMVDNWSTYYKVKFKKVEENEFSLIFENDQFGQDKLNFSKGEKPLFDPLTGLDKSRN